MGVALGIVTLIAAGAIYFLKRQVQHLRVENKDLAAMAAAAAGTPPSFEPPSNHFRTSLMPPLSAPSASPPATLAPSHVPSMQEFAAFKALYGASIAYQNSLEAQGMSPVSYPHRLSELDSRAVMTGEHLNTGVGAHETIYEDEQAPRSERDGSTEPQTAVTQTQTSTFG